MILALRWVLTLWRISSLWLTICLLGILGLLLVVVIALSRHCCVFVKLRAGALEVGVARGVELTYLRCITSMDGVIVCRRKRWRVKVLLT